MNKKLNAALLLILSLTVILIILLKSHSISINNPQKNKIYINEKPILIGLNNIGATCYMNAALQCLSNTKELTSYFLTKYKEDQSKTISNEYYKLIQNLWDSRNNNMHYSPHSFKKAIEKEEPLFEGVNANDAKDLILFLLEKLHEELNIEGDGNQNDNLKINQTDEQATLNLFLQKFKKEYNSPISNLFYFMKKITTQCTNCHRQTYNFQIDSFIDFPLKDINKYIHKKIGIPLENDEQNPTLSLYKCFEHYQRVDRLSGDNQIYCHICKNKSDTLCRSVLYSAPNNLIINLNRGPAAIYKCNVDFPEYLDLSHYVAFKDINAKFELYAVICHYGPSSEAGHFVAYCKNIMDNKWYLYNDSVVTECTEQGEYNKGMPYILFYRAKN